MKGIDISYHQGNINFAQVASSGIEFVIPRCGYGSHTDKKFFEYVTQCKAVGLNIPAVYFFSYALNAAGALKEATYATLCVKQAELPKDTIIFYDFEYDTVNNAKKTGVNLTRNEFNAFAIAFCEHVTKEGYRAGVYVNKDYYKNWMNQDLKSRGYVMWLADYSGGPDYPCDIQQSSSSGSVPGINTKVDMDEVINPNVFKVQNQPTGVQGETTKKTVDDIAQEVIEGKWGVQQDRKNRLEAAGYDYKEVQDKVNYILKQKDISRSVRYQATGNVWLRSGPGTNKTRLVVVSKGQDVLVDETKETTVNGTAWMYITATINGKQVKGYSSKKYYQKL